MKSDFVVKSFMKSGDSVLNTSKRRIKTAVKGKPKLTDKPLLFLDDNMNRIING